MFVNTGEQKHPKCAAVSTKNYNPHVCMQKHLKYIKMVMIGT